MTEELIKARKLVLRTEILYRDDQEDLVHEYVEKMSGIVSKMNEHPDFMAVGEAETFDLTTTLADFTVPETTEVERYYDTDLPMELTTWLQGYHGVGEGIAEKIMNQFTEDKVIWGLAQMDPDNISEEFRARISPDRGAQLDWSTVRRMIEDAQELVYGEQEYELA